MAEGSDGTTGVGSAAGGEASGSFYGTAAVPTSFSGGSTTVDKPAFLDIVPAEYRDKPWIQDVARSEDPYQAFFKQHESAQSLIGKKTAGIEIPGEGASEEVTKAFYKALGVPDSAEGYQYAPPDVSKEPEDFQKVVAELSKDDSLVKAMQAQAHKIGLTPKQFTELASAFDGIRLEELRQTMATEQGLEAKKFEDQRNSFKTIYGDKADYVERIAKETAAKVLPESVRATGDPELALFEAMRFIHEKLYQNDTVNSVGSGAGASLSKDQIKARIMELRSKPAFRDQFSQGYAAISKEVDELYNQLHA